MSYKVRPSINTALKLFPKEDNKKFMEVMRTEQQITEGMPVNMARGVKSLFETYALIQGRHDFRKIVKYTTDLEIKKLEIAAKMRELENQSNRDRYNYEIENRILTIYVEKKYQEDVDNITKKANDARFFIESERCAAIKKINRCTMDITKGMDSRYCEILKKEEIMLAVYRNYLKDFKESSIDKHDMMRYMMDAAINRSDLSDEKFKIVFNTIEKMLKNNELVSFKDFIGMRNTISVKGNRQL